MAADEDVRGRFRCQSAGRTLAPGLALRELAKIFEEIWLSAGSNSGRRFPSAHCAFLIYTPNVRYGQGLDAYLGNLLKIAPANNPQEARRTPNRA
ncbi:hypothetical protein ACP3TH_10920 [Desulforudis sp. 1031]|uniref:hypothetical protein n=1 Tax=unclassified Candidatus Desulforudis TaxID=2635950 RepID=UPI003CE4E117